MSAPNHRCAMIRSPALRHPCLASRETRASPCRSGFAVLGATTRGERQQLKIKSGTVTFRPSRNFKACQAHLIRPKVLDRDGLSVRAAHDRAGIAGADFSRIRNANLGRFAVDRLMSIINRLGSRVDVKIRARRADTVQHAVTV